jgi:hypothetical protein
MLHVYAHAIDGTARGVGMVALRDLFLPIVARITHGRNEFKRYFEREAQSHRESGDRWVAKANKLEAEVDALRQRAERAERERDAEVVRVAKMYEIPMGHLAKAISELSTRGRAEGIVHGAEAIDECVTRMLDMIVDFNQKLAAVGDVLPTDEQCNAAWRAAPKDRSIVHVVLDLVRPAFVRFRQRAEQAERDRADAIASRDAKWAAAKRMIESTLSENASFRVKLAEAEDLIVAIVEVLVNEIAPHLPSPEVQERARALGAKLELVKATFAAERAGATS